MHLAIIGAGISGLSCAERLTTSGHTVTLFDKGRGPGGRMSTRRFDSPVGPLFFDHGAQYFTARDADFREVVAEWHDAGVVTLWPAAGPDTWIGLPTMSAVIKHMAAWHCVQWDTLVTGMVRHNGLWRLSSSLEDLGSFDAVVLAIPAEQAAAMLSLHDFALSRIALTARSQPCWTGMFAFESVLETLPPIIRDTGSIAWAARNNAKPGRGGQETWVVQASAQWSAKWLEASKEQVADLLIAALAAVAGCALPAPALSDAHRWRYALSSGTGHKSLWNADLSLGACGDWLLGPRIECAWLSGQHLANCIVTAPTDRILTGSNLRSARPAITLV
jgi:renalase